jgi:hypothetical protein
VAEYLGRTDPNLSDPLSHTDWRQTHLDDIY